MVMAARRAGYHRGMSSILNPSRASRSNGVLIAIAAAPAFGLSTILAKLALADGASPLGVLVLRFGLATLILVGIVIVLRRKWPSRPDMLKLLVIGALGQGAMAFCFFSALEHASAGLTTLLLYLHPALIAIAEVLLRWERMGRVKLAAIVVATIGCAFTIGGGGGTPVGIAWGIGAAVTLTAYLLMLKRFAAHADSYVSSALLIGGTALVFAVAATVAPPPLPQTVSGWSAVVALAIIATVVGTLLLLAALARLPASDVSTLMTIEPVFAIVVGWIVLGEAAGPMQMAGAALIVGSVILLAKYGPADAAPRPARR
jgi:drug/metabolite transporter (DMT)-like permease